MSGIQVVDAQQTSRQKSPSASGSASSSTSIASMIRASRNQSRNSPRDAPRDARPQPVEIEPDDTLAGIANLRKMRTSRFENEQSDESSGQRSYRQEGMSSLQQMPVAAPPQNELPDSASSSPLPVSRRTNKRRDHKAVFQDASDSSDEDQDDMQMPDPFSAPRLDPMEEEMQKAIRKAKLLARIDQLEGRGVKPSKHFTYRSAEDELIVEVARMETLAHRGVRIKQGRAMFISSIGAMEKGANMCDDNQWLPWYWHLHDFTKATVKDITNYDDALERGVEKVFGSGGEWPWYLELAFVLVPAMVTHSTMNRFKDNPEHTSKVLNQNPQLRTQVARELAQEQLRADREERLEIEQRARDEIQQNQKAFTSATGLQPRVRMSAPPTATLLSATVPSRPEEIPANPADTLAMQAELERNQAVQRQRRELQEQQRRISQLENALERHNQLQNAPKQKSGNDDDSMDIVIE